MTAGSSRSQDVAVPDEVVEAAAIDWWTRKYEGGWPRANPWNRAHARREVLAVLAAAVPVLRERWRDSIADEIEAKADRRDHTGTGLHFYDPRTEFRRAGWLAGMDFAAELVRGVRSEGAEQ